jgi:hypothetical protein
VLNFLLACATTRDLLYLISDTIRAHLDVWNAMDTLSSLAMSLGQAHERLRSNNIWVRPAMSLLKRLDEAGKLDTRTKTQMQMDYASLHQVGHQRSIELTRLTWPLSRSTLSPITRIRRPQSSLRSVHLPGTLRRPFVRRWLTLYGTSTTPTSNGGCWPG